MSPAEVRKKRGLELLHLKLNALRQLLSHTQEAIAMTYGVGVIGPAEVELLGEDVNALIRIIASRRWDLATPEAITMARILAELARPTNEGD